jgi:hypothetical protein
MAHDMATSTKIPSHKTPHHTNNLSPGFENAKKTSPPKQLEPVIVKLVWWEEKTQVQAWY